MSTEYLENTFEYDDGDRPGSLIINTNSEDLNRYDLGTWRTSFPGPSQYITVDAAFLHAFADYVKENIPEPSPIAKARFIHGVNINLGDKVYLAKIDGTWYDEINTQYTEEDVLRSYTKIEVIR